MTATINSGILKYIMRGIIQLVRLIEVKLKRTLKRMWLNKNKMFKKMRYWNRMNFMKKIKRLTIIMTMIFNEYDIIS